MDQVTLPAAALRLESERLLLRPFAAEDFDAVHAWASDEEVTRFTPWGPNTEKETRDFVAHAISAAAETPPTEIQFALVERESGTTVGSCSVVRQRGAPRDYEIGWTLDRRFWRRGFATEAARRVMDFSFARLDAVRLVAPIAAENRPSIALATRLGFREQSRSSKGMIIRGAWHEHAVFVYHGPGATSKESATHHE